MVTDDATGEQIAESLLQDVGNEQMRAATRLLGAHRDGFWLRRFLDEESELTDEIDRPAIDRSGAHPSVDWDSIGLLMLSRPAVFRSSRSELAVLEVAASLVTRCGVQLGQVLQAVDEKEFRAILRALQEATYGERAVETIVSTGGGPGAGR
ncbi:hypothetical protein [Streptomyces sp. NPDC013489]|uniref:hypothetical protein n=1 Tax=Streptomyces sp. NPDC013489 TaxID=3155606 RepID=UPI0033E9F12B